MEVSFYIILSASMLHQLNILSTPALGYIYAALNESRETGAHEIRLHRVNVLQNRHSIFLYCVPSY